MPFEWTSSLCVNIAFMDNDHRQLIAKVDDFYDAFRKGPNSEIVEKLLDDLLVFTEQHFQREEDEMLRIEYPGYKAHAFEHRRLLDNLTQLGIDFKVGEIFLPATISRFMHDWLIRHIKGADHALAKAIRENDQCHH